MAAGGELLSVGMVNPDLTPSPKPGRQLGVARGIGDLEVVERFVAEHDPEAIGVPRLIPLQDPDPVPLSLLGEENRQIEPGRATPDDHDIQTSLAHLGPIEPTLGGRCPGLRSR